MNKEIPTHPVQINRKSRELSGKIPQAVSLKAYEVYCHVYAPQVSLITGSCRGGFSAGELIAFLYASSFPKTEWRDRVEEAFNGMVGL